MIHRAGKLGLGTATVLGFQEAVKLDSIEMVATLDADLSHDPVSLAQMVHALDSDSEDPVDVIIGSRYVRGGEIHGWPWYRRFASYLVNQYAQRVLRLPVRDNTSAMRVYRMSTLKRVNLNWLKSPGYAYLEEILVLLKQNGGKFMEHSHYLQKSRNRGIQSRSARARQFSLGDPEVIL